MENDEMNNELIFVTTRYYEDISKIEFKINLNKKKYITPVKNITLQHINFYRFSY